MIFYYPRAVAVIDWKVRPVALVTGGASGIGRASARALAQRGARVVILDLDDTRGPAVAEELGARWIHADVTSSRDWANAVERIGSELGPIEIAHLNAGVMTLPPTAGIGAASDLAEIADSLYRRIVGVNVDGVFFGLRSLVPGMAARNRGRIVVTASTGALTAVPFDPLYAMTKHAVVGLVRSASAVLRNQGIGLCAICPGGVDTSLVPEYVRALALPLLAPEEVGRAVLALLDSEDGSGIFVIKAGRPEPFPEAAIDLA